jgi:hypothetical protein
MSRSCAIKERRETSIASRHGRSPDRDAVKFSVSATASLTMAMAPNLLIDRAGNDRHTLLPGDIGKKIRRYRTYPKPPSSLRLRRESTLGRSNATSRGQGIHIPCPLSLERRATARS